MSEVLGGKSTPDQLVVTSDKTQVYGLKGNDTIISNNHKDVLLIGGSGDDSLIMQGGNGTLSGGKGSDVFELTYSANQKISAVIEDYEPSIDKIVVNFDGTIPAPPQLIRETVGSDVVLKDSNFELTLKGVRDNNYFDGSGSAADDERFFEILKLTNNERENPTMPKAPDASADSKKYEKYTAEYEGQQELVAEAKTKNLPWLTLAEDLTDGASIRAEEITELALKGTFDEEKHTRPSGQSYATVIVDKDLNLSLSGKYVSYGENLQAGAPTPAEAVEEWIGSLSHHKNILDADNNNYLKLGVGYNHNDTYSKNNKYDYWVQLFGGSSKLPATTLDLSGISAPTVNLVSKSVTLGANDSPYSNPVNGATISGTSSNESIHNTGLLVSISSGSGSDTIENSGANSTINAGTGDDSIKLSSDANLIQYREGDGSDTVSGFNVTDTLSIVEGEYTPVTIGNDVFVNVGSASIKLSGASTLPTVNIEGRRSKLFVLRDNIADTLNNTVDGATIQALGGDDTITNSGNNVSIVAGAGNDSLVNNGGKNVLFVYESGEDTIEGFNATSTLKIAEDTATSLNANGNLVLTVGTGKITLKNAAGLSSINVVNSNGATVTIRDAKDIRGDGTANTLFNTIPVDGATIQAFGGDDTITNSGNNVSIVAGEGNDVIDNSGAKVTIHGGAGNDQVKNSQKHGNVYIYESGDDTIEGFNGSDTLDIGDYTSETVASNGNVIVNISSNSATVGSITLKDYSGTPNIDSTHYVISFKSGIDTIISSNSVIFTGTTFNDTIRNEGDNVTIAGLSGNDRIFNGGYWGDGSSHDGGSNVSIHGGNGRDLIHNYGYKVTITAGSDDDTILNTHGYDGDNSIRYGGDSTSIDGGEGKDSISNHCLAVTITGGNNNDTIRNDGSETSIVGDAGHDSIYNNASSVTISGGSGDDAIYNDSLGHYTSIDGGEGKDFIRNYSGGKNVTVTSGVTVNGGGDDDYIINGDSRNGTYSSLGSYSYLAGDAGNDEIVNYGEYSTISGGNDNDTVYNYGYRDDADNWHGANNALIDGGAGKDSINNHGDSTTIIGGDNDDTIENWQGNNSSISGGDGKDSILNWSEKVTINGGNDNDTINNSGYQNDAGNWKGANNALIDGGADNDSIRNDGANVTIIGGTGDDRIILSSNSKNNVIQYSLGDGNDTVWGYSSTDTLNLLLTESELKSCASVVSGNDVIIKVGTGTPNAGSIRLKDAKGKPLKVTYGESGKEAGLRDGGSDNDNSSSGKGDDSGSGDDKSKGGTSDTENANNNAASGGDKSAQGSSGSGNTNGNTKGDNNNDTEKTSTVKTSSSTQPTSTTTTDGVSNLLPQNQTATTANQDTGETEIPNFGVITGTEGSELLVAEEGGSTLWGGLDYAQDTLVGNVGADVFIVGKTQGADIILNASSGDIVFLNDAILSDIVSVGEIDGTIGIAFNNGNFIGVQNSDANSATFMLADGSAYQYNIATKTWQITQYVYPGNNMIISDYASDKRVLFRAEYTGAFFDDAGNFVSGSTTGLLAVQNAADKVIDLRDYAGNPCFKAYAATAAGIIDGRGTTGFEIINGSAGEDIIYAGDGSSQLWGGNGDAADTLIGGNGTDIFIGGKTQGKDIFLNASSTDIVHLNDVMLSDIIATEENNGNIAIAFNNGNAVGIQSTEPLSAAVMLADGLAYRYNHATKSWQNA